MVDLVYRHDHTGMTAQECAATLGIGASSWRTMVARRLAPGPTGFDSRTGVRVWDAGAFMRWVGEGRPPRRGAVFPPRKPKRRPPVRPYTEPVDAVWVGELLPPGYAVLDPRAYASATPPDPPPETKTGEDG